MRGTNAHFGAVAALAESAYIADFQHVTRCRSVLLVTGSTSIGSLSVVLIEERSAFILMALHTECFGVSAELMLFV